MELTTRQGHPRLVKAVSALYSGLIGRTIDPESEVVITIGAHEALFCAMMAHVNLGDEVIIIEPAYDCYEPLVRLAGGVPVFLPLRHPIRASGSDSNIFHSNDWPFDLIELASKFGARTKAIIVNTPHNPVGKVLTAKELEEIGILCEKHNTIIFMDEVFEWLVFPPLVHTRMASMSRFWNRTVTFGSAGKTFSVTGWKLGWAYGPEHLIRAMQAVHQNTTAVCATPVQEAVAIGLEVETTRIGHPESYWRSLAEVTCRKRDRLSAALVDAGISVTVPDSCPFIICDFSRLATRISKLQETGDDDKDLRAVADDEYGLVKWISVRRKLQGIPVSAFYSQDNKSLASGLIRFCFLKDFETLDDAATVIKRLGDEFSSAPSPASQHRIVGTVCDVASIPNREATPVSDS